MAEGTPHEIVRPLVGHILELAAAPQRAARRDRQRLSRRGRRAGVWRPAASACGRCRARDGATCRARWRTPASRSTHLRPVEPTLEDVFTELLAQAET